MVLPSGLFDIGNVVMWVVYVFIRFLKLINLRFWGYTVCIGKNPEKAIDLIAQRNGEFVYIQVAYLLSINNGSEREFGNLLNIRDNYPKYVVSMDDFPAITTFKGIKHMHLIDFLCLDDLL
jgi:predicted AAA+ superfamily ATPase